MYLSRPSNTSADKVNQYKILTSAKNKKDNVRSVSINAWKHNAQQGQIHWIGSQFSTKHASTCRSIYRKQVPRILSYPYCPFNNCFQNFRKAPKVSCTVMSGYNGKDKGMHLQLTTRKVRQINPQT